MFPATAVIEWLHTLKELANLGSLSAALDGVWRPFQWTLP